jgi:protein SCO1/2
MTSVSTQKDRGYFWLYVIAIVISIVLGIFVGARHLEGEPVYNNAQLLPAPKVLPDFDLINQYEAPVDNSVWKEHWSLVFFGFTSCPDICPLELQKLAKLLRLADGNVALQVVFVSIDPERDSSVKLREYTGFFHPDIIALSGNNPELARIAQFFGAAYDRSVIIDNKLLNVPAGIDMPEGSGDFYQVNHSARVFIVNPDGAYSGSFMPPFNTETLWGDLVQIVERWKSLYRVTN